jgi:hypothetical protein
VAISGQTTVTNDNRNHPNLYYAGCIVFDRFLIPPYTPRKALNAKSFPFHDACIFVLAQQHAQYQATMESPHEPTHKSNDERRRRARVLFPPTIPQKYEQEENVTSTLTRLLVKVNPALILSIRKCHLERVASSHKSRNEKVTSIMTPCQLGQAASIHKSDNKRVKRERPCHPVRRQHRRRHHAKKTKNEQKL